MCVVLSVTALEELFDTVNIVIFFLIRDILF